MQAGDEGKSGSAGGQDGQGGPGGSGGSGDPCDSGVEAAGSPLLVASADDAPALGGEASPLAGGSPRDLQEFSLRMPFPSIVEAQIAYRSLMQLEGPQLHAIQRELSVAGNILTVWMAEDLDPVRYAFISFLEQLFLVVQTMQHFRPVSHYVCPRKGA